MLTVNITIDATRVDEYVISELDAHIRQWLAAYQGSCSAQNRFPCCATITSINNRKVTIQQTKVLNSKEVGILILRYTSLSISNSLLAYNRINCIIYVSNNSANTTTVLINNQILFGKEHSFNLASGVNIVLVSISFLRNRFDSISMRNTTLTNNIAPKGNVYLLVYRGTECKNLASVRIAITNNVVTSTRATSGITMEYIILESIPLRCKLGSYKIWPQCIQSGTTSPKDTPVIYHILNSYFEGSCIIVKNLLNQVLLIHKYVGITLNKIRINKSLCPVALRLENISSSYDTNRIPFIIHKGNITIPPNDGHSQVHIQDLAISSSRNNIMLLTALDKRVRPIRFQGNTTFTDNQGSIVAVMATIYIQGNVLISRNHARNKESIFLIRDASSVSFSGDIAFINNTGRQGGAISAHSSKLTFEGRLTFIGNIAQTVGGGISLREGSMISLTKTTSLSFCANIAKEYGGGLFVEEILLWEKEMILKCFAQTYSINNIIIFNNNRAGVAGMALFGGWIDVCNPGTNVRPNQLFKFGKYPNINYANTFSDISSNAARVCICKNFIPNINITNFEIATTPGRTFVVEVVAVGQRFGVVPAIVKAEFQNQNGNENIITELQRSQNVGIHCKNLSYTVRSRYKKETMQLTLIDKQVPKPDPTLEIDIHQFQQLQITIHLNKCPPGLIFDSNRNICVCYYPLEEQGIQCNISSHTVIRNTQKWISTIDVDKIAVSHHCPYDYCKSYELSLNLSTPGDQCAFSRSGVLCGTCQPGQSQVLGTSNCKKCSTTWLLLLLPFGLAGVALVVCLMMLNITVSTGTINGLIFYANIVRANHAIFFPDQSDNMFLSWFIAWLNLDLGIETCFYDGLTAYTKTWLQFVFPAYIWILVIIIIISTRYSIRAATICGNNAVQVLATLFYLSYAKLLRVTITVLQPAHLLILDDSLNRIRVVWNYDGNIKYLGGRHAPLFVITLLLFIVFFIPYTLVLFGIQWLQSISHHRPLHWVTRFKPLFDAYTGPYKDKHRYWTGLLLLLRIGLFCVFSANTTGDPAVNLLVIIIAMVCLFVYLGMIGGVPRM
jgi:predicted outer membrane repeat protein